MTREEKNKRNEQMRAYKAQGHTMKEVADKFNMSVAHTQEICRGIAPQIRIGSHDNCKNQYTSGKYDRVANAIKYIGERTLNFEYAGNFTGIDGFADIRCKTCGTVSRKSFVSIRHGKAKCSECARRKRAEEREAERNKRKEQKKIEKERRENNKLLHTYGEQITLRVCLQCGDMFVPMCVTQTYCSRECANRRQYSIRKDKRVRKMRAVVVDKDITIEKLYRRDKGKCYICGRLCDWNDYEVKNGAFIANNSYPSIDHVIPLSKNGKHTWSNIRLACRGCNSAKSDKLPLPMVYVG
jgi:5-methylcytosine-specific restriction endonuclease McrA